MLFTRVRVSALYCPSWIRLATCSNGMSSSTFVSWLTVAQCFKALSVVRSLKGSGLIWRWIEIFVCGTAMLIIKTPFVSFRLMVFDLEFVTFIIVQVSFWRIVVFSLSILKQLNFGYCLISKQMVVYLEISSFVSSGQVIHPPSLLIKLLLMMSLNSQKTSLSNEKNVCFCRSMLWLYSNL